MERIKERVKSGYSNKQHIEYDVINMTIDDTINHLNSTRHLHVIAPNGSLYRARSNGMIKQWKTRPLDLRVPIKIGFKGYGYINIEEDRYISESYKPVNILAKHTYKQGVWITEETSVQL